MPYGGQEEQGDPGRATPGDGRVTSRGAGHKAGHVENGGPRITRGNGGGGKQGEKGGKAEKAARGTRAKGHVGQLRVGPPDVGGGEARDPARGGGTCT